MNQGQISLYWYTLPLAYRETHETETDFASSKARPVVPPTLRKSHPLCLVNNAYLMHPVPEVVHRCSQRHVNTPLDELYG
jgi:hypothetical protein